MTESHPLHWPEGWPRTPAHKRQPSRFSPAGLAAEAEHVYAQLSLLGARYPVVSTNIAVRRDGLPYSARKRPDDPGVAVYFEMDGRQQCIPCDRWATVEENTRAIWKSIEALRSLDRWGAKSFVDAAFRGFQALPAPGSAATWHQVLGVEPTASRDEIERAFREKAKRAHPDAGGSASAMAALSEARAKAMEGRRG